MTNDETIWEAFDRILAQHPEVKIKYPGTEIELIRTLTRAFLEESGKFTDVDFRLVAVNLLTDWLERTKGEG